MSLLLVSELSAAKLHAVASNDVFEGLSEQDSKLAQVGAHGWSALSTPCFWVGHSRSNEQAKVEELTRQMLHSKPAERISVTELKRTGSQVGRRFAEDILHRTHVPVCRRGRRLRGRRVLRNIGCMIKRC
jgi:hypothetical protein